MLKTRKLTLFFPLLVGACALTAWSRVSAQPAPEPTADRPAAPARTDAPGAPDAADASGAPAPSAPTDAARAPDAADASGAPASSAPPTQPSATEPPPASAPSAQPGAPATEPPPGSSAEAPPSVEGQFEDAAESYRFEESVDCPYCEVAPVPVQRRGLHWHKHWGRVGLQEYLTIGISGLTGLGTFLLLDPSTSASWNGPFLFDRAVQDVLVFESRSRQRVAHEVSDWLVGFAFVHPLLVDNFLVTLIGHESPDVAYQMFVINVQAYAVTLAASGLTKRLTNRARPWAEDCVPGETGRDCEEPGRNQSFYSGHSAMTATGAGLICAHHTQLMLYDNPILDVGACVLGVVGTATTGALRISSNNHWPTDVVIGHLAGYLAGYLMPTLLYYREFSFVPHEHEEPLEPPSFTVVPVFTDGQFGVVAAGLF